MVDTYVDEIAISRALRADRAVWANLTRHEREEALVRARERRQAEQAENAEWREVGRIVGSALHGESGFLPHPRVHPDWLVAVSEAAGYADPEHLLAAARRVERRREAA